MSLPERSSPVGKKVSLFVTCIVDMIYPETGMSVVDILEYLGIKVDFPMSQTCCGQPGFNAGYRDDARQVAQQFIRSFENAEVIVTPSGSCAAMVRHEYPTLFADDPVWHPWAVQMAARTWEFTEFLVDGLGITDVGARLPQKQSFAVHEACHGLRMLGLGRQAKTLLEHIENAEIRPLNEADVCCGFGGLFSIKMAEVSSAMLRKKVSNIEDSEADTILTGDVSCMTQMNGGLSRKQSGKRVRHIADVLAEGIRSAQPSENPTHSAE
jgi:L-lactate dehydrogenase complex protein LldE